jgi:hypothetical protein
MVPAVMFFIVKVPAPPQALNETPAVKIVSAAEKVKELTLTVALPTESALDCHITVGDSL